MAITKLGVCPNCETHRSLNFLTEAGARMYDAEQERPAWCSECTTPIDPESVYWTEDAQSIDGTCTECEAQETLLQLDDAGRDIFGSDHKFWCRACHQASSERQ